MERFSGLLSNKLNQQQLVNESGYHIQLCQTRFIKLSWQTLTLHCTEELRRVKFWRNHLFSFNREISPAHLPEEPGSGFHYSDIDCIFKIWPWYCVCTYAYTHIYSTVMLQESFFNFPFYFFIHINQISLFQLQRCTCIKP